DGIAIRLAHRFDPQPVIAVPEVVLEHRDRLVDVADDNVGAAVVIEIAKGGATAQVLELEKRTGPFGNILKSHLPGLISRLGGTSEQNRPLQQLRRLYRKADDMAVGDKDVLGPVEIVIDKADAEADVVEADRGDAGAAASKDELRLRNWSDARIGHIAI